jgi:hypothetical protein
MFVEILVARKFVTTAHSCKNCLAITQISIASSHCAFQAQFLFHRGSFLMFGQLSYLALRFGLQNRNREKISSL